MNPWWLFGAFLAHNYSRHRRGRSTFCSTGREVVPPWLFLLVLGRFNRWFIPHWLNGYKPRPDT